MGKEEVGFWDFWTMRLLEQGLLDKGARTKSESCTILRAIFIKNVISNEQAQGKAGREEKSYTSDKRAAEQRIRFLTRTSFRNDIFISKNNDC
ncbi:hypothetical protein GCM10022210_06440 [Mucilaginibacter dorajii]|uniref:Uncharacterized protein n=1 Tax=Mucilaginibacter dorajii TaxID=692994 RepID=A0ABP7P942_9SPHI